MAKKHRSKFIGFFVEPEFREMIDKIVSFSKMSLSEYIRELIRNDLIQKKLINFEQINESLMIS